MGVAVKVIRLMAAALLALAMAGCDKLDQNLIPDSERWEEFYELPNSDGSTLKVYFDRKGINRVGNDTDFWLKMSMSVNDGSGGVGLMQFSINCEEKKMKAKYIKFDTVESDGSKQSLVKNENDLNGFVTPVLPDGIQEKLYSRVCA
jgi:hypothetical protein